MEVTQSKIRIAASEARSPLDIFLEATDAELDYWRSVVPEHAWDRLITPNEHELTAQVKEILEASGFDSRKLRDALQAFRQHLLDVTAAARAKGGVLYTRTTTDILKDNYSRLSTCAFSRGEIDSIERLMTAGDDITEVHPGHVSFASGRTITRGEIVAELLPGHKLTSDADVADAVRAFEASSTPRVESQGNGFQNPDGTRAWSK